MGKRLEVLRRSESRDSLDSLSSRDSVTCTTNKQPAVWPLGQRTPSNDGDRSSSPSSTLKGFFTRIGSTGMLSYSRLYSNCSFREKLQRSCGKRSTERQLYRSVSTSHLQEAASSYMKGDDPADCLDRGGPDPPRTPRDVDDDDRHHHDHGRSASDIESPTEPGYVPLKTRSCDNISRLGCSSTTKKPNFPYAFLRSRLSVLPEENGGSVISHLARASVKRRSGPCGGAHEIVVTEELFKEMDNDREYRRVFSNLSSSNESGYDSDGPCRTSSLDTTMVGTAYPTHHHRKACCSTDEDSGFGDTKSLAADSLNEFEEHQSSEPSPSGGGRLQQHSSDNKDYNVPSMCLFYKKNRELNDRVRSDGQPPKDTPNFHRRMFVKNRSPPAAVATSAAITVTGTTADLSSLPVDLNNLRSRMQIVRLLKSRYEDDIGIYLKMLVKQVANYNETRFIVMKLEPGKIAYR